MNMTIWKYEVEPFMQLPKGFKILSCQWQFKKMVIWAQIPDTKAELVSVEIVEVLTGQPVTICDDFKFLGTFQHHSGEYITHMFWRQL
jgi:hypothetical protein